METKKLPLTNPSSDILCTPLIYDESKSSVFCGPDSRKKRRCSAYLGEVFIYKIWKKKINCTWLKDVVLHNTRGHVWAAWPQALPVYHADRSTNWATSKLIWINLKEHPLFIYLYILTFHTYLAGISQQLFSSRRFIYISEGMAMKFNDVTLNDTCTVYLHKAWKWNPEPRSFLVRGKSSEWRFECGFSVCVTCFYERISLCLPKDFCKVLIEQVYLLFPVQDFDLNIKPPVTSCHAPIFRQCHDFCANIVCDGFSLRFLVAYMFAHCHTVMIWGDVEKEQSWR